MHNTQHFAFGFSSQQILMYPFLFITYLGISGGSFFVYLELLLYLQD